MNINKLSSIKGEKESLKDASQLIELAKKFNNTSDNLFSEMDCFSYSEFCSKRLNINEYPEYQFYSNGRLIKRIAYLPEVNVIIDTFKM